MIIDIFQMPNPRPSLKTKFDCSVTVCCPVIIDGRIEAENYLPFGKASTIKPNTKPGVLLEIWEYKTPFYHVHQAIDIGRGIKNLITTSYIYGNKPFVHIPNQSRIKYGSVKMSLPLWHAQLYANHMLDDNSRLTDDVYMYALEELFKADARTPTIDISNMENGLMYELDNACRRAEEDIRKPRFLKHSIADIFQDLCGHKYTNIRGISDIVEMMDPYGRVSWEDIMRIMNKPLDRVEKNVKRDIAGEGFLNMESPSGSQRALFWNTIPTKNPNESPAIVQKLRDLVRAVLIFSNAKDDFSIRLDTHPATGKMYITKVKIIDRNHLGEFASTSNGDQITKEEKEKIDNIKRAFEEYAKDTWSIPLGDFKFIVLNKVGLNLFVIAFSQEATDVSGAYRFTIPMAPVITDIMVFHHGDCQTQQVKAESK